MSLTHLVCLQCGAQHPPHILMAACTGCGSPWLDARYDLERAKEVWRTPAHLADRERSLWRYHELLPIEPPDRLMIHGEGYTPLVHLSEHARSSDSDHAHLYMKDERQNSTGSFKDRQAAVAVTALKRAGIIECVLASTGNAGIAYAAYCARAGIRLWLFLTSAVPPEKVRAAERCGAEVRCIDDSYDVTKQAAAEFAEANGIYLDRGAKSVPGKESMKTLAYEIAAQLGLTFDASGERWIAPDWYIQAVSGGIGPLGVWKGFCELYEMELIDRLPKLAIVQAAGCAPMVRAFAANQTFADPIVPDTLVTVLSTGNPGYSYTLLREAVLSRGGTMLAVEDAHTFSVMHDLELRDGIQVEPATAVAFAGLEHLLKDGTITLNEVVVVNGSGNTLHRIETDLLI